GGPYSYGL
uniref:Carcinustatin-16 n=1 Tax=Carcinus maenas TaxID=6759 RepID=ALL16_CARMA|nr:RecName: Full=Carcinustatin-16 [Carcinus maenas]